MEIVATSSVEAVSVFARGAMVTRLVTVSPVDGGMLDVVVPDVTVAALPGSVRVRAEDTSRRIVSVHTALEIPETRPRDAPGEARALELEAEIQRLRAFRDLLVGRREELLALEIAPDVALRPQTDVPADALAARVSEALRVTDLLGKLAADLDARVADLTEKLRLRERELEAAMLALHQAGATQRDLARPTRAVRIRLAGAGPVGVLRLTYAVEAAGWFPTHTLRFEAGGKGGEWTVEGLVVQATLEDWDGVRLSLSTADMGFDARLPELASLRFGRAQKKRIRAYRPLPNDLDRLFEAHDRAFAGKLDDEDEEDEVVKTIARSVSFDEAVTVAVKGALSTAAPEGGTAEHASFGRVSELDEDMTPADTRFTDADLEMARSAAAPDAMPMPARAGGAKSRLSIGGLGGRARRKAAPAQAARPDPLPSIDPDDAWLDFDRLTLASPEHPRRGRLVLSPRDSGGAGVLVSKIGEAIPYDLAVRRGMFDHRYEALASARVPSDGHLARVPIAKGTFSARFAFRTVPSASQEVFREAVFTNPFGFPVLGGPAQIFVDGSLVASSELEPTDRDGTVKVGTGVEERLKVARNVRVTEETTGLLGGSLAVRHDVSIEISSSLGFGVEVVVIERVPVTEDKAVEVDLLATRPKTEPYDQAARGSPVKGGRQFILAVPAGTKQTCDVSYELKFSSKLELSGGNRRE